MSGRIRSLIFNRSILVLLAALILAVVAALVFLRVFKLPESNLLGQGLAFASIALLGVGARMRRDDKVDDLLSPGYRRVVSHPRWGYAFIILTILATGFLFLLIK